MLIQTCTQENKEALFDEMSSDVGQLLAVDTMDTLSEFCEIFDGTSKQVVSDDESELLMIYKTEVLDAPDDDKIMFTYSIPMDVCFPSYNKPSYVIKHVVDTLFSENLSQDYIVALLPHLPFLG